MKLTIGSLVQLQSKSKEIDNHIKKTFQEMVLPTMSERYLVLSLAIARSIDERCFGLPKPWLNAQTKISRKLGEYLLVESIINIDVDIYDLAKTFMGKERAPANPVVLYSNSNKKAFVGWPVGMEEYKIMDLLSNLKKQYREMYSDEELARLSYEFHLASFLGREHEIPLSDLERMSMLAAKYEKENR